MLQLTPVAQAGTFLAASSQAAGMVQSTSSHMRLEMATLLIVSSCVLGSSILPFWI